TDGRTCEGPVTVSRSSARGLPPSPAQTPAATVCGSALPPPPGAVRARALPPPPGGEARRPRPRRRPRQSADPPSLLLPARCVRWRCRSVPRGRAPLDHEVLEEAVADLGLGGPRSRPGQREPGRGVDDAPHPGPALLGAEIPLALLHHQVAGVL